MKLDRNTNPDGRGKYALVLLRKVDQLDRHPELQAGIQAELQAAIDLLASMGLVDYGSTPDTDFFVIRLKDKYAAAALKAYSDEAFKDDPEYGQEILNLAARAAAGPGRMPD